MNLNKINLIIILWIIFNSKAFALPLKVVSSVPYLKDLVSNITCQSSQYAVTSLVSPGVDPHTFLLTLSNRIVLKNANMILQIGAGFEPWLDKIEKNSGQRRIVLSQHLTFGKMLNLENKSNNNLNLVVDYHIWHSPELTKQAVQLLLKNLIELNPQDKQHLELCASNYLKSIVYVENKLKKQVSLIPEQNRILATNHDSLAYFAKSFGFKIYSILGLSDEAQPTISQIQNMITLLKQKHIKAIFLESTGNSKSVQTISQNAQVPIGGKLYGDSLGEPGSGADTTLEMWQSNMSIIFEALR